MGNSQLMVEYHDKEWGVPVHDDRALFEFLVLEGAQAGLSWQTVLNKRENYRRAFHAFEPAKIARYNNKDVQRLLRDPGIIRNRLKIQATINNAKQILQLQKESGSLDKYIWAVCGRQTNQAQIPVAQRDSFDRKGIRRYEQRPTEKGPTFRRPDNLLRVHASCWNGERSHQQMLQV